MKLKNRFGVFSFPELKLFRSDYKNPSEAISHKGHRAAADLEDWVY